MKQFVKATAILAGLLAFSGIGFAQCKIGVVDMQEAVTGSAEGKEKAAKFDLRVKEWTDKLDKIKADIDTAQKKLQSQQGVASQTILAGLNKTITDKQTELQRTSEDAQKDVDEYRDSLLSPVMEVAQKTMSELVMEKGYDIVYDMSAPNSPIVYASKVCNITDEIKTRLNAKGPTAGTAKPAAPSTNTAAPKLPAGNTTPAGNATAPKPPAPTNTPAAAPK